MAVKARSSRVRQTAFQLMAALGWCLLALATSGSPARAQSASAITGVRPELHVNLGWHGQFGFGARVDIPVLPEGLIGSTNDELAISPGLDLFLDEHDNHDHGISFAVPCAMQWNFYLGDWSLFPELGLVLTSGHHHKKGHHDGVRPGLLFAVGGRYHLSSRNAFVLRLSWPSGVQLGATF